MKIGVFTAVLVAAIVMLAFIDAQFISPWIESLGVGPFFARFADFLLIAIETVLSAVLAVRIAGGSVRELFLS
jgi:hypothetical protein